MAYRKPKSQKAWFIPMDRNPQVDKEENKSDYSSISRTTYTLDSSSNASEVKLPPFWGKDPVLWFAQVDKQFKAKHVMDSTCKYELVVANLDPEAAEIVRELIIQTPKVLPYETLRSAMIARTTLSNQERIRQLISNEPLGDQKPSTLLRKLRVLVEGSGAENILKTLFLNRLPSNVRTILSAMSDKTLDELASSADEMVEIAKESIMEVESQDCSLLAEIEKLRREVADLSRQINQTNQESRNLKHLSMQSKDETEGSDTCWYHQTFGQKATKCKSPCKYVSLNE